jgi:hypothetical protein
MTLTQIKSIVVYSGVGRKFTNRPESKKKNVMDLNNYSLTLWYRRFYDNVYACPISTIFVAIFFNLTTTVP